MDRIIFNNGKPPYLNDETLEELQDNIEKAIEQSNKMAIPITRKLVTVQEQITQNTDYTVPQKYVVGKNDMFVLYEGTLLIPNINYKEVGTKDQESTTIQFIDWDIPSGSYLEFIYR